MSWVAREDLAAMDDPSPEEMGPTLRAARDLEVPRVALLSNHRKALEKRKVERYAAWISSECGAEVDVLDVDLTDPSDHIAIRAEATRSVERVQAEHPDAELHFLLSAGTPAMHAVWLLLGKARFHARLVKCSKESGTQFVELPFEISTDFAEGLLERSDETLVRLTQGLPPNAPEFSGLVAGCKPMKEAVAIAQRLAPRSVPVLILGESGTGKELFARAIHRASPRHARPFLALNCGAIPAELIDSRLFGHRKGAFTGAIEESRGVFEEADGGTLLLDEIGELPLDAQVRLLRTLQENEVVRVGENKPRKIDVRILAATHVDLFEAVERGTFRGDLLYRLAVGIVRLPALRERGRDVHVLIDQLLTEVQSELHDQPDFTPRRLTDGARTRLTQHPWPGNVRELRTTLVRAALFASGDRIDRSDVEYALLPTRTTAVAGIMERPLGPGFDLHALQDELRAHYVERAMKEAGGVKAKAARLMNSPPQTFQDWVK
jgi:DNA-binding NtrC family response regulator